MLFIRNITTRGFMKDIILPQIIAIGVYNARLAVKNKEITPSRRVNMFEIELPIEDGGISYIDKESASINQNTLIIAKPGQVRHTKLPFKCYFVHAILTDGELYDRLTSMPSYVNVKNRDVYVDIFKKLCEYYDSGLESDRLMLGSKMLELIYLLNNEAGAQKFYNDRGNAQVIQSVIEYIKNNLDEDLSLQALSKYASFSPTHFHTCFKKSTGLTLREYVEECRIRHGVNLLVSTNLTLSEIAYECGFSSQSYFSYAFKRRMNMTPRKYAKHILQKYEK